jgi:hypothetical protein
MQGKVVFKSFFTSFLVLIITFSAGTHLFAQDNVILAYGAVKDFNTNKKLESVDITILQNGSPFENFITPGNGKYEFELPLGHIYSVNFSLDGYIGKKLQLDTKGIPEEDMAGGFQMSLDMSLFEYIEGFDSSILDVPIGKSSFDPQQNAMSWDEGHTSRMQDKIQDEFERLDNLGEELAKLREEFNELVAKGDQKMIEEKFSDAIGNYEEALKIFDEEPVQKKLADAEAAYAAANADAEREANYQRLIAQAKNDIKKKSFENAQDALKEAIELKPDEREPKDLLNQIAKDLEEIEKRKQYESLVADADSKFKNEDYAVSIDIYNQALDLFGSEDYPRGQIKEAQKRIDEKRAADLANADLEAKYKAAIDLGNKNMKDEEYQVALRNFEEAKGLKENEKLPKAKIAEIEGILADLAAQADRNQAQDLANAETDRINKEYQALIIAADEKFQSEQLNEAKKDYLAALEVKSEEKYPKSRIDKIDDLLAMAIADAGDAAAENEARLEAERINNEYQALITSADTKFDSEQLKAAKEDYEAALVLKNQEKYPKSRITRIDDLIAEQNALADNSAAEAAAAKREAERLEAEDAERLARQNKADQKELDRERRLREEELERERVAAEKTAREEEERRRSEDFANTANSSTEDDAERYYREARESEERAKKIAIEEKKDSYEKFLADENADARIRRQDQAELLASKEDRLERIYRDGEMNREMKIDYSENEKDDYSRNITEYTSDANKRRADNSSDAITKSETHRSIDENDVYRQTKVDRSSRDKETYQANSSEYDARGASLRQGNEYDVKRSKEKGRDQKGDGELVRLENQKDSEFKKNTYAKYTGDLQAAADERLSSLEDKTVNKKQAYKDISEGKEVYREENVYNVDKAKENNAYLLSDKSDEARLKSYDARKEAFDKQSTEPRDAEDYILPEGAEDLSEGVQERSYEEGNKMVIERIVKRGNIVNTFRKIISKTGIYYFKDGRSITESTWKRETLNATD